MEAVNQLARTVEPYELGQTLWPIYLRGLVHMKTGRFEDAAAAFRASCRSAVRRDSRSGTRWRTFSWRARWREAAITPAAAKLMKIFWKCGRAPIRIFQILIDARKEYALSLKP